MQIFYFQCFLFVFVLLNIEDSICYLCVILMQGPR